MTPSLGNLRLLQSQRVVKPWEVITDAFPTCRLVAIRLEISEFVGSCFDKSQFELEDSVAYSRRTGAPRGPVTAVALLYWYYSGAWRLKSLLPTG